MTSPFYCNSCDQEFSTKGSLIRHNHTFHDRSDEYTLACENCEAIFKRKDKLKQHLINCVDNFKLQCYRCDKIFSRAYTLKRHFLHCSGDKLKNEEEEENIRKKMIARNDNYIKQLHRGKIISKILNEVDSIMEESLDDSDKKDLELYLLSSTMNHNNIKLRNWQKDLLYYLDEPHERKIIWVYGVEGNEGKTFFQKYVSSLYGYKRVNYMEMVAKSKDIFHVLSKQTLACKDIFLFNISRNLKTSDVAYDAIEGVKDGLVLSSKYNSKIIKFKTPNVVMIFSNLPPIVDTLSIDRWEIFQIKNNELLPSTQRITKRSYSNYQDKTYKRGSANDNYGQYDSD